MSRKSKEGCKWNALRDVMETKLIEKKIGGVGGGSKSAVTLLSTNECILKDTLLR